MSVTKKALVLALAASGFAVPAQAAFQLSNTNGGDGYVTSVTSTGFDLFGADNDSGPNYTEYFDVASSTQTLTFSYVYTTNDQAGAYFDPAGFYNNGVFTQLSPTSGGPGTTVSGTYTATVLLGSTYGFYVQTNDGDLGRADIKVSTAAVPESAAWATMMLGLGGIGMMRRRKSLRTDTATAAA